MNKEGNDTPTPPDQGAGCESSWEEPMDSVTSPQGPASTSELDGSIHEPSTLDQGGEEARTGDSAADSEVTYGGPAAADEAERSVAMESGTEAQEGSEPNDGEAPCSLANIMEAMDTMSLEVREMGVRFDRRIARTDAEAKVIDRMHEELQSYRSDLYGQLIRPILKGVIGLRENLLKVVSTYEQKLEEERNVPLSTLASFVDDMTQVLGDADVEVFASSSGEPFDPKRHRAVERVRTDKSELSKTIAGTFGDGYEYRGKTLSPQMVSVYVYSDKS